MESFLVSDVKVSQNVSRVILDVGFFRRTLKRTKEYTCRYNGNCVVDKYERNSCRFW
jgi:hypothetical protein